MWFNNARTTGTNTIPIGKKRRLPGFMNFVEDKAPLITPSSNQWIAPSSLAIGGGVVETASKKFARTVNDAPFANIKQADEDDVPRGRQMLRRSTGNQNSSYTLLPPLPNYHITFSRESSEVSLGK